MQMDLEILIALQKYIVYKTNERDSIDRTKIAQKIGADFGPMGYPYDDLEKLKIVQIDAVIQASQLIISLIR